MESVIQAEQRESNTLQYSRIKFSILEAIMKTAAVPFDVYDIPTFQANNTQESQNQIVIGNNQASDRRGHSSVSYQGRTYIWGGVNPTFLNTLEIYDPEQDSWNNEPSTSGVLRENFVMEQIKGKLLFTVVLTHRVW